MPCFAAIMPTSFIFFIYAILAAQEISKRASPGAIALFYRNDYSQLEEGSMLPNRKSHT